MIDRQYGNLLFECDSCPDIFQTDTDDFSDAWEKAKCEGWKTRKLGNLWVHACQQCAVQ